MQHQITIMNTIITRTEEISLDSSGIVICKVFKDVYMNLSDAIENIAAVKEIASGKKVPVLVDIRESKGATKQCRDYFAGDEAERVQKACALIVSSPLSVIVGSFFIGLNRTKFPTKLFRNEEPALEWLLAFNNKDNV